MFEGDSGGDDDLCPIAFGARKGDLLRIVAEDGQEDCFGLDPLYLVSFSGGSPRQLSDGVPLDCDNPAAVGEFFDETFTI